MSEIHHAARVRPGLSALARESLLLGVLGFGGGFSVLALIRNRIVERHRWLSEKEFTNAATIAQMLPGGAAANVLAYVGLRFGGQRGAAVAYAGFCFPGFVAILALAIAYKRWGTTADVDSILAGLNAAVVGIIAAITVKMLSSAIARLWQMCVAVGALLMALVSGASPLEVVLLGLVSGLIIDVLLKRKRARSIARKGPGPVALPEEGARLPEKSGDTATLHLPPAIPFLLLAGVALATSSLAKLGFVFFRTGLGAYGGGFAIIPHLQAVLKENHWLTSREFANAVAMGKLTPGPVLLMATFIGYELGGFPAALMATAAILLGPYLLVVTVGTALNRMRNRLAVRAALRGLTPAVVGLMAAAGISLGDSLRGPADYGIAAGAALTLIRFPVNPVAILVLGGLLGIAARYVH